jgi:hypothetical protein
VSALEDVARIWILELGSVVIEVTEEHVSLDEVRDPTAWQKNRLWLM